MAPYVTEWEKRIKVQVLQDPLFPANKIFVLLYMVLQLISCHTKMKVWVFFPGTRPLHNLAIHFRHQVWNILRLPSLG